MLEGHLNDLRPLQVLVLYALPKKINIFEWMKLSIRGWDITAGHIDIELDPYKALKRD